MTEPAEKHQLFNPSTGDPKSDLEDVVRQMNEILLRIAQEIAAKADA
jgi:hypothetical protein